MSKKNNNNSGNGKEKKKIKKILYIGRDMEYWGDIQKKYSQLYPDEQFKFTNDFKDPSEKIITLLNKISKRPPEVILLDYSVYTDSMLRLGFALRNEYSTRGITLIGLMDNLDSKEILRKSLSLGIYINVVKGIELSNVVHHSFVLAYPDNAKKLEVALATTPFSSNGITPFNIGYISSKYIHLETNFSFKEEDVITLKINALKDLDLTGKYKVVRVGNSNLYSSYNYWVDLEYVLEDNSAVERIEKKIVELSKQLEKDPKNHDLKYDYSVHHNELNLEKKKIKDDGDRRVQIISEWVKKHQIASKPKRTRLLIIDKDMALLNENLKDNANPLDGFNFSIRYQSHFDAESDHIQRIHPGIIFLNFGVKNNKQVDIKNNNSNGKKTDKGNSKQEEKKEDEAGARVGDGMEVLTTVIEKVKSIERYSPIVIAYNCDEDEEGLKKSLGYPKFTCYHDSINHQMIKDFVNSYEGKEGRKLTHSIEDGPASLDDRIYLDKYNVDSIAEYSVPIEVVAISEAQMNFYCNSNIPSFATFYTKKPVKMTITVVPFEDKVQSKDGGGGGAFQYYSLIHGTNEIDKNHLRKHINSLFFAELEAKKKEEREEFERLNKEAKEKMIEDEILEQKVEEEEKKEKEAVKEEKEKVEDKKEEDKKDEKEEKKQIA